MLWQPTRGLLQPNQSWRRPQTPVAGGGAPLDGISGLTGAWSMSRALLTAYGGSFYTLGSGSDVNTLYDQSGNIRHFVNPGGTGSTGSLVTAGTNSRACARFDGVDDFMTTPGFTLANFITASTGYIVASCILRAATTANNSYTSDTLFCDSGAYMGMHINSNGPTFLCYNYDGSEDYIPTSGANTSIGARAVVEWRHDSGTLYNRVNSGTEVSVASGNTQLLTGTLKIAASTAAVYTEIDIFEMAAFSSIPSSGDRDAIVSSFATWVG